MGFKRPFDDVDFQELPYKHSRQLECSDKRASSSDLISCYSSPQKPYVSGEDGEALSKFRWLEVLEKYNAGKDLAALSTGRVINAPSTLVTASCVEENVGSGLDSSSPRTGYFEYDCPQKAFSPFKDDYSSLLYSSPRKHVSLGPNHQAIIPSWTGCKKKLIQEDGGNPNCSFPSSMADNHREEKLFGTTVILMPEEKLSPSECDMVGFGRANCSCLDPGTNRCVQQHVMEAREELRRTLGNEKFMKLGFSDMGEEAVVRRWSEEEEQMFHEVVYSNPVSVGRKFWKHLSEVFPCRSKRELVSYYFNVFMLRRRAAQNRSITLEIDSDDDEWHVSYGRPNGGTVAEDDEDSVIDSVEDVQEGHREDYSDEDDSDDDDDDSAGDGDGDGNGYLGYGADGGMDQIGHSYFMKSDYDGQYHTLTRNGERISGCSEEFGYQDDSCVSFEFQPDMHDSCCQLDAEPAGGALQATEFKAERSKGLSQLDTSSDVVGHGYVLEPCDAKVWNARFPLDPLKNIDLLPTWSMIEDIFDQGMGDYEITDDQKTSSSG